MATFRQLLSTTQMVFYMALAETIRRANPDDAADFAFAVDYVLRRTDITPIHLADACQVTEATMRRWASGQVAPHKLVREVSLEQIAKLIETRARELGAPEADAPQPSLSV